MGFGVGMGPRFRGDDKEERRAAFAVVLRS